MKNEADMSSASRVILLCGPAGSGKSTVAKSLKSAGMIILSYDEESFKRGINVHPLPEEVEKEIKAYLDEKLISLIEQNIDIVLDYSFWSKEARTEYLSFFKKYGIEPKIYYIKTPKEVVMERIRRRNGNDQNSIILTEQIASLYYDHFEPPTADEGAVIVIEGY